MYQVLPYRSQFKSQILNLLTDLWTSSLEDNARYFAWKYEANPYASDPFFYVALHGDRVVGARGLFAGRWRLGSETMTCLCPGDTVVDRGHRQHGIARELTRRMLLDQADRGRQFLLHLTSGSVMRRVSYEFGGQSVGPLEQWERTAGSANGNGVPVGAVVVEERPQPEEMSALVERLSSDGRIQQIRDDDFFSWRFRNPLARYRFFFSRPNGILEGYLVLQTAAKTGHGRGCIVDWEASRADVFADLLAGAVSTSGLESIKVWGLTVPSGWKHILERFGFQCRQVSGGRGPMPLVVPTRQDWPASQWVIGGRSLRDVADWNLRMIFADSF
jgi:hypothetical protein